MSKAFLNTLSEKTKSHYSADFTCPLSLTLKTDGEIAKIQINFNGVFKPKTICFINKSTGDVIAEDVAGNPGNVIANVAGPGPVMYAVNAAMGYHLSIQAARREAATREARAHRVQPVVVSGRPLF